MAIDWQELAALAIVAVVVAWTGWRWWRRRAAGRQAACGDCAAPAKAPTEAPLTFHRRRP